MKRYLSPGITLGFHHYHAGNDPERVMRKHGCIYATKATIKNETTGVILATAWSRCSKKDSPSRRVGREVAGGRAVKQWEFMTCPS